MNVPTLVSWSKMNKFRILFLAILLIPICGFCSEKPDASDLRQIVETVKDGDIIFQISESSLSKAIQVATHSIYSHVGIIYKIGKRAYVFEASRIVKLTPIKEWIERGEKGHFVVKRLKNAKSLLTPAVLRKMKKAGEKYKGKKYDSYFEWSDEKMYCSELVWKIYKHGAGIEIGKLKRLEEFDLKDPIVKKQLSKRYGMNVPLKEIVISPADMFDSEKTEVVLEKR